MKKFLFCCMAPALSGALVTLPAWSSEAEIEALKKEFEQRLKALEDKQAASTSNAAASSSSAFNPQISLILDGRFAAYRNDPEDYELPGFALGGEAELAEEGFSLGHTELTASANIDDRFRGQFTMALHEHEGETETEVEEAYFESIGLGNGFIVRGGRFFPAVGYINQQHDHAWDFADAPLVYTGLWGNKYIDDGVRLSWLAPTDLMLELGVEALAAGKFPAGGEADTGIGSQVYFANLGGDVGDSHSWQAGVSYYSADVENRESGGHDHGGGATETPSFTGDSDVLGLNAIYKWAPGGNYKQRFFKLQGEYFQRQEDGEVTMLNSGPPEESSSCDCDQRGFYVQAIYQFQPQWRVGVRYDKLNSDNEGSDMAVLEEAGLASEGINPERKSIMLEWNASEFSRLRLQFNHDESYEDTDQQVFLQYTMSLGAHGAHSF